MVNVNASEMPAASPPLQSLRICKIGELAGLVANRFQLSRHWKPYMEILPRRCRPAHFCGPIWKILFSHISKKKVKRQGPHFPDLKYPDEINHHVASALLRSLSWFTKHAWNLVTTKSWALTLRGVRPKRGFWAILANKRSGPAGIITGRPRFERV